MMLRVIVADVAGFRSANYWIFRPNNLVADSVSNISDTVSNFADAVGNINDVVGNRFVRRKITVSV